MIQFRQHMKAVGHVALSMPYDVIVECIGGVVLCAWGATVVGGSFKTIHSAPLLAKRPYDSLMYSEDSAVFNHRGRQLARLRDAAAGGPRQYQPFELQRQYQFGPTAGSS